ncbi:corA-like mg2+ transporter protein domain-containing protein [Pochonia chlamydosporia 170]|uniref:CorA-like mg2+ transporter protein domain-containing protein n=1 Tax=Pochonia chlamydosporia 170 TaxID=1380566 RepID=A0A179F3C4_METCM|nr:corA-like mg2+ transporter protein domain-containing protein [Pochonia chlamydosporia 170]OAQ59915.1 corA-like mg2+ transporter protein domain-containing protein [Pochonia chlamydosporia 170]
MERVTTISHAPGGWKVQDSTWDNILQVSPKQLHSLHCPTVARPAEQCFDVVQQAKSRSRGHVIFAQLRAIAKASEAHRAQFIRKFELEPVLLTNLCLDSNGFAGCSPGFDEHGQLASYKIWSRFVVKQILDKLRPKRSFIRRSVASNPPKTNAPIHTSRSITNGWEWYEMDFHVHWTTSSFTVLCFNLPGHLQHAVEETFISNAAGAEFSDPYRIFATIINTLLPVYDNSVWSIRNHICQWEAARKEEPDYPLLHEIARYAIHVSETIAVAAKSLKDLQSQHQKFLMLRNRGQPSTEQAKSSDCPFNFPLMILEGQLSRSKSNECRVQNETQLAFHMATQRDSSTQLRIAEEAKKEASTMKAIAVITMTFLPATFVSVR